MERLLCRCWKSWEAKVDFRETQRLAMLSSCNHPVPGRTTWGGGASTGRSGGPPVSCRCSPLTSPALKPKGKRPEKCRRWWQYTEGSFVNLYVRSNIFFFFFPKNAVGQIYSDFKFPLSRTVLGPQKVPNKHLMDEWGNELRQIEYVTCPNPCEVLDTLSYRFLW